METYQQYATYSLSKFTDAIYEEIIYDSVYLRYLLDEERDWEVTDYIEDKFPDESNSQTHQINLMRKYPFFANKILDNEKLTDEEKHELFFLNTLRSKGSNKGRIILIAGAMGGGKTGFGCWACDEQNKVFKRKYKYFFVTKSAKHPKLPKWFKIVDSIDDVENDSIALIDEGVLSLNARKFGSPENIRASESLVQLRQRGITLFILVQHLLMIDINVRRLATIIVVKYGGSIELGKRKVAYEVSKDLELLRNRLKPKNVQHAYIEIPSRNIYMRFSHGLPMWWDDEETSKYMKDWDLKKEREEKIAEKKRKIEEEEQKKLDLFKKKVEIRAEAYSKRGLKSPKIKQPSPEFNPMD